MVTRPGTTGKSGRPPGAVGKNYRIEVPGDPVAKARPKATKGKGGFIRVYTPENSLNYENRVRFAAREMDVRPIDGPVELRILFCCAAPKHLHKKRKPFQGGWRDKRPDLDNLVKAVLDGLNTIAYVDDARVSRISAEKLHAPQGLPGKTVIWISELLLPPTYFPYYDD